MLQQQQQRQAASSETIIARYIFSLRSELPEEIEYALPNLARHSFERRDFELRRFSQISTVEALLAWPLAWLEDVRNWEQRPGAWCVDEARQTRENRASTALLILRNAAATDVNAVYLSRPLNKLSKTLAFLTALWTRPLSELLEISLEQPELLLHSLGILHSLILNLPNTNLNPSLEEDPDVEKFFPTPEFIHVLQTTLPLFIQQSTDSAFHVAILPILAQTPTLSYLPPPLPATTHALITHLFTTLALPPNSTHILAALDTLYTYTLAPKTALIHISTPNVNLLARLLQYGATPHNITWQAPRVARTIRNPASEDARLERAAGLRSTLRRIAGTHEEVGDSQIILSDRVKQQLVNLKEPERCLSWMHKTFVANPTAELTQLTFWTAYKDFFAGYQTLLSASEVIKNVTTAFPGALAKVLPQADGSNRFVIAGLGFRKSTEAEDHYVCCWAGCASPIGPTSAAMLQEHLVNTHLTAETDQCRWATCSYRPFSLAHLATHFPSPSTPRPNDFLSVNDVIRDVSKPTTRPPPLLSDKFKLGFTAYNTPTAGQPVRPYGEAALAALTLRNLARALRAELGSELETETDQAERIYRAGQRLNGLPDKHGLPIPESVLKEEADEGEGGGGETEVRMGREERERAKNAFRTLESMIEEIMVSNRIGLGEYLAECWGWN